MPRRRWTLSALSLLLLLGLLPITSSLRPFVLVITKDDLKDSPDSEPPDDSPDWDDFDDPGSASDDDEDRDPGSWRPVFETSSSSSNSSSSDDPREDLYISGMRAMISAASSGDPDALDSASSDIEAAASAGHRHAQSALAFLFGTGLARPQSRPRSFLYHHFAAEAGNMQSKMVLAYTYFRQDLYDKAVALYAELAEAAVASFLISKEPPVIEPVRIHSGTEENKEALRKSRGEDDEGVQITEYQAHKGNAAAMYAMGVLYYYGLRGLRPDYAKAVYWFSKAVEKRDPRAMELLGEIYARGAGVERNYTKAFEWLTLASRQQYYSAYNGLGYLYVKGYGVEKKNFTKAREYFEKAAENKEPGGHYNLGVLYLKGMGVKKDVTLACKLFLTAANAGQPKALYQVAKLFQKGIGFKKNLQMATLLYKTVAERGPWSSLSRWALESYLKGDVGKALFLYSRMAELGYEVAQSNAAWLLDKYGEQSMCMGESGFCTDTERHLRAHSLWWQASEQGNEHAALLIGDAYYYGRGTERDYERAAEAYMHAQSQSNAQAMFNLGYMHEHGQGLPLDLHLAKRYYDQALEIDPAAKLPVTLALTSLWIRKNHADSLLAGFRRGSSERFNNATLSCPLCMGLWQDN
ncbi:ERAD-associated E3 ubiquitin-protein ligase component HRD3-like isoform X2 [Phoenix dactylifera]|uniref:ERAD-associated E3 ubiquitin-protein ligase component HRD3-like isoform X2 n=1 Tax=Phoenix dactylifera TaxID=42345 RepID=A0A8B9AGJ6_PHODC|nr:ERAD-associated E3 ubiquitin-protein ligase component HRD3-like isoform X2 [Phoenix dactylifera]